MAKKVANKKTKPAASEKTCEIQDSLEKHRAFWEAYAEAYAQPFQQNGLISRFVTNPNVTGCYAETWIRLTAQRMLGQHFRISTGAVIRSGDIGRGLEKVPQCDLIIWDPSEQPGLFEAGDFALVPLAAVRGLIEIKRTIPSVKSFRNQLIERQQLVPKNRLLGVAVSHSSNLRDFKCTPNWLVEKANAANAPSMTRLLDKKNHVDTDGVMAFIYFLAQVAGHNRPFVT